MMRVQRSLPRSHSTVKLIGYPALIALAGLWLWSSRPDESLRDRALRICGTCDLDAETVDWLIDNIAHSTLTSEAHLNLFRDQFEDPSKAELCRPCADAVIAAAGRVVVPDRPLQGAAPPESPRLVARGVLGRKTIADTLPIADSKRFCAPAQVAVAGGFTSIGKKRRTGSDRVNPICAAQNSETPQFHVSRLFSST